MRPSAEYWINKLQLTKHIEGGSYKEVYRSGISLPQQYLPTGFHGDRNACTSIYFLLEQNQFSALHKIASDELWHFYFGDALVIYEIDAQGSLQEHLLGNDPEKGGHFQCVIKAGSWFGSKVAAGGTYALVGCTVSPGFDFADFELAQRADLLKWYPEHEQVITLLTR